MTAPDFASDLAPPGIEYRPVEFWQDRPVIATPRSIFVHTMAASVPTSVQSAWNHAHRAPGTNTCPTYAVGLEQGDAAKFLPSDRRSIATTTVQPSSDPASPAGKRWASLEPWQQTEILQYGNVRDWSLSIETADTGYLADPAISAFNDWQIEAVATIIAYESHLNGFPLEFLVRWFGAGVGCHTLPDEYPFTTLYPGKFCPGSKKKAQVQSEILPEARRIITGWFPPPPPPPSGEEPVTDEDIERIAQRAAALVWERQVTVPEGGTRPAVWVLGQGYVLTRRAVKASEEAAANTRT
jgi:hypothetical protein